MLWQRVISSLVIIPILLAAVWFGDPWISIIAAFFALLGAFEFYKLADTAGWQPFSILGIVFVLLFLLNTHSEDGRTTPLLISGAVVLPLIRVLWCSNKEKAFINWAWTIGGIFYIGWTMSHFILLRELGDGRSWVLVVLLVTFASDSVAFLVGRTWGRHRMTPSISPGKTWEGAIGAVIGAVAAMAIMALATGLDRFGYVLLIPLGFLISIFAQIGDLVESMLKRDAGVKDAGKLIPGHGGVLDRLDSLIFTVVLVYYYVVWLVG